MGTWGSGALENDTALDFVGDIKRCRKTARASKIEQALQAYLDFDQTLRDGTNVSTIDAEGVADLLASRASTLEWYASIGEPPPLDVMPELATEDAWAAHVGALAQPQIDNGAHQAQCAIAAAQLILDGSRSEGAIAFLDRPALSRLAMIAADVLPMILNNAVLAESWQAEDYRQFCAVVGGLIERLRAIAQPTV